MWNIYDVNLKYETKNEIFILLYLTLKNSTLRKTYILIYLIILMIAKLILNKK